MLICRFRKSHMRSPDYRICFQRHHVYGYCPLLKDNHAELLDRSIMIHLEQLFLLLISIVFYKDD